MTKRALYLTLAAAALLISVPMSLWAYDQYQTQQILNRNVAAAADDYADAMRNLNDELQRFRHSP